MISSALMHSYGISPEEVAEHGAGQGQALRFQIKASPKRFMAKLYPAGAEAAVDRECAYIGHLKAKGQSVAANVKTLGGQNFATVDGRPLVLYEWAEGAPEWPPSETKAHRLGHAIAAMHLAGNDFDPGHHCEYDLATVVDRPVALLEPFCGGQPEWATFLNLTKEIRKRLSAVPTATQTFGPIHGDIHQGNCVFDENAEPTLFDFSLCGSGYLLYDLTGYLWPMRDQIIQDPAIKNACQSFLGGYRSGRQFVPEEESALTAFVQVRTLWETGDWIATGTGASQPEEVSKAVPYMVRQFSAWMDA